MGKFGRHTVNPKEILLISSHILKPLSTHFCADGGEKKGCGAQDISRASRKN